MSVIKDEYISDSIVRSDLLPLSFLEMSPYTGQKGALRFRLEKRMGEESGDRLGEKLICCFSWKGAFSFDHTEKECMEEALFPFSEEGLKEIIDYLNERLHAL